MKLAFINIYQDLVDRGAETFVREASERLSKKHEVKIFSGKKIPPPRWPFLWRSFLDSQGLAIALFTLKILLEIWRGKYDVVIPLNGGWQPAIIRIVTWLYGGKMIISGQSGIGWDDRNNLWCIPNVFVPISSYAAVWARKANPLVRVEYIPNGVDLNKFKPGGEAVPPSRWKKTVLCVGALSKSKRIDLAIKAVASLKGVSLLVAGDGDLKEELKALGSRLLGERFQLIKVPYEEMPGVYRSADVLTLPSESSEAFGNVLVEAMASGLPVVVNDDPVRREIVGEAGIFVDPTNSKEYARALEKALKTDWRDKQSLAKSGFCKPRQQAKKFDWDKIAEKYEELFLEII